LRRTSRRDATTAANGRNRRPERNGESAAHIAAFAIARASQAALSARALQSENNGLASWHGDCAVNRRVLCIPPSHSLLETAMKQYLNVLRVVAVTVALSFVAGACNTIQGAGKDIERGGQKIERAADKAKD
jgi:entericidin B